MGTVRIRRSLFRVNADAYTYTTTRPDGIVE